MMAEPPGLKPRCRAPGLLHLFISIFVEVGQLDRVAQIEVLCLSQDLALPDDFENSLAALVSRCMPRSRSTAFIDTKYIFRELLASATPPLTLATRKSRILRWPASSADVKTSSAAESLALRSAFMNRFVLQSARSQ
jgi:hypothetical protein